MKNSASIIVFGIVLVGGLAFAPNLAQGQPWIPSIPQGNITMNLETVSAGQLTSPVYATHAGDGSGRLFVSHSAARSTEFS